MAALKSQNDESRIEIARLVGQRHGATAFYSICIVAGFLAMGMALLLVASPTELAAWGAIWTGWNVLCGVGVLAETRTDYTVYRTVTKSSSDN